MKYMKSEALQFIFLRHYSKTESYCILHFEANTTILKIFFRPVIDCLSTGLERVFLETKIAEQSILPNESFD